MTTTRVRDLYQRVAVHATADREHEAAIELLLLVMVADQHISPEEIEAIRSVSEESGWESDTFSFDQYVGVAMAKVRKAAADDATDELLDDIDGRISSTVLRHGLFSACRDIAGADHDIDDAEASLLGQVAARFG
jgi:uncharacterized tellurite resistance protein B-like protein